MPIVLLKGMLLVEIIAMQIIDRKEDVNSKDKKEFETIVFLSYCDKL